MKRFTAPLLPIKPSTRVAGTLIAAVCAAGVNMGLLELFGQASSERGPGATPQMPQARAPCEAERAREARKRCTREGVARSLSPGASYALLAGR